MTYRQGRSLQDAGSSASPKDPNPLSREREQSAGMTHATRPPRANRHLHSATNRRDVPIRHRLRAVLAALMATGGLFLLLSTGASAATLNGTATIEAPDSSALTYPASSTTLFTITASTGAVCSNSTAGDGTKVYTYLVPKGTNLQSLTVASNVISTGYAIFDYTGAPIENLQVASNDVVPTLSNQLEWEPAVTSSLLSTLLAGTDGVWEAGIACVNGTGELTDNWNTEVTFTADSGDPNGFTWKAVPGDPSGSTTTTTAAGTTATTAAGTTATTVAGSTSTTTAAGSTSTTTTPSSSGSSGVGGAGTSSGSSGSTGSSGTSSTGGALAFTGLPAPVGKIFGAGLLGIGLGLMLLGTSSRRRTRSRWAN